MAIRVLIVDDSAFVRRALKKIIGDEPDFEIVASAANGQLALRALDETTVDVVVLDIEMPVMDGLQALDAIRARDRNLPVVMFSTLTTRGSEATMEALTRGASDYVAKPNGQDSQEDAFQAVRDHLVPRLRSMAQTRAIRPRSVDGTPRPAPAAPTGRSGPVPIIPPGKTAADIIAERRPHGGPARIDLVAIGVSTGGPSALQAVIGGLPADLGVPVLVTQHMPPRFTDLLAQRLDQSSPLSVREARDRDPIQAGHVLLAAGDYHLVVREDGGTKRVALDQGPPVNSCRPSVDVMLASVAEHYGERVLVVILTGMGKDGLEGSRHLANLGAHVIAQDAATSVVWGMPGFVAREGVADAVLPLDEIAPEIVRLVGGGVARELPTGAGVTA